MDSLEMVRQLFETGVLQSGFWHRFAMTAHSPVGLEPAHFEVEKTGPDFGGFADNDFYHEDTKGGEHDLFSEGLRVSLFNYMHGAGLDLPLQKWFETKVPKTNIPRTFIAKALQDGLRKITKHNAIVVWLGNKPEITHFEATIKGKKVKLAELEFFDKKKDWTLQTPAEEGAWIAAIIPSLLITSQSPLPFKALKENYETTLGKSFEVFETSAAWKELRGNGLLVL
jgi:hypothetical protein